jgi:hypothetical protein
MEGFAMSVMFDAIFRVSACEQTATRLLEASTGEPTIHGRA